MLPTLSSASSWSFGSTSRFGGGGGMSFDFVEVSSAGMAAGSADSFGVDSCCSAGEGVSAEVEFELFEDEGFGEECRRGGYT